MGTLRYGNTAIEIDIEDRLLAHLQVVIGLKLSCHENFFFSWPDDTAGGGRSAVWLSEAMPLSFSYTTDAMPAINKKWANALLETAHSPGGLRVVPEPGAGSPVEQPRSTVATALHQNA